jgi:hypothetical protein
MVARQDTLKCLAFCLRHFVQRTIVGQLKVTDSLGDVAPIRKRQFDLAVFGVFESVG